MSATCSWRSKKSTLRPMSRRAASCRAPRAISGGARLERRSRARSANALAAPGAAPRPSPTKRTASGPGRRRRTASADRGQSSRIRLQRQALAHPLARDPDLASASSTSTRVWMARPPPTTESPPVLVEPGDRARFFCAPRGTRSTTSSSRRRGEHVAVEARHRVLAGAPVDLGQVAHGAARAHHAASPASSGRMPASFSRLDARARAGVRTSPAVGGSDFRKASESAQRAEGQAHALASAGGRGSGRPAGCRRRRRRSTP